MSTASAPTDVASRQEDVQGGGIATRHLLHRTLEPCSRQAILNYIYLLKR